MLQIQSFCLWTKILLFIFLCQRWIPLRSYFSRWRWPCKRLHLHWGRCRGWGCWCCLSTTFRTNICSRQRHRCCLQGWDLRQSDHHSSCWYWWGTRSRHRCCQWYLHLKIVIFWYDEFFFLRYLAKKLVRTFSSTLSAFVSYSVKEFSPFPVFTLK